MLLLAFLALSIVVITLDFQQNPGGPLERAKDISAAIIAPIQRGVTTILRPVGDFFSGLADLANLRSENEQLERELLEIEARAEESETNEELIAKLRDNLELNEPWFTMESVTADVIGTPPNNYKWAVTIGKGADDGIEPDMAVIDASARAVVGRVVDVTNHSATVLLLIDPQSGAAARIQGVRDTGLVEGNGAGEDLSMVRVGTGVQVSTGDTVVTSAYNNGVFPPDIPIGTVSRVSGDEAALSQEIEVVPRVDFANLQLVQVLLESGPVPGDRAEAR